MKCALLAAASIPIVLVLVWQSPEAGEQAPATAGKTPEEICASIMSVVGNGDFDGAVKLIETAAVEFPELEFISFQQKSVKFRAILNQTHGDTIGAEFVRRMTLGDSWVRIVYLEKLEKYSLVWIFDFYRPKNEWLLRNFTFSDELGNWFETSK